MNVLDQLEEAGVRWERQFCEFGEGETYISFRREHPHAIGYHEYRAIIYVLRDGVWKHREFKPEHGLGQSAPAIREDCFRQAEAWADKYLGGPEWVAGPFRDSWQTRETRERALARLKEMRAS